MGVYKNRECKLSGTCRSTLMNHNLQSKQYWYCVFYIGGRRLRACIFMVFLLHINNQIIFIILNNQHNKTHNNVLFNLQFCSHGKLLTLFLLCSIDTYVWPRDDMQNGLEVPNKINDKLIVLRVKFKNKSLHVIDFFILLATFLILATVYPHSSLSLWCYQRFFSSMW